MKSLRVWCKGKLNKVKPLVPWMFKAYILWSIIADVTLLAGIIYLAIYGVPILN
jgi:hypothetical protein